jgi:cold shock CspA family protein/uncharacterized small protein (DUF1192 family)
MKELYVIDGTNLINVLSIDTEPEQRKFGPLLQLLLAILERNESFFCYFDASTRFMFEEESIDRQMYDILIGLRIFDYFEQVKGGVQADKLILQQADATDSRVISMDTFTQFYDEFTWIERDSDFRLITADVIQNHLRVDKLGIKTEMLEKQTKEMCLEMINRLELERGNLLGVIKKYDSARRFGLIQRAKGGPTLLFHRNQVIDKDLDYTISGQTVTFKVDFRFNKGKKKFDFCAADIEESKTEIEVETVTDAEKLKQYQEENVQLKELIGGLKKRNRDLNDNTHNLEADIELKNQFLEEKNEKIEALETEIRRLKAEKKLQTETYQKEVEVMRSERNELAIAVDFQEQKIRNLDDDLQDTLKLFKDNNVDATDLVMYEKMKTNYVILQDSVKQKEARIIFLRNNIQMLHNELEHLETMDSVKEVQQLRDKIESLERVNEELKRRLNRINESKSENSLLRELGKNSNGNSKRTRNITDLTNDDLKNWWRSLTNEWQMAFNKAFFADGEVTNLPSPEDLKSLLGTENIEIIGERILFGGFKRLTFKLSDLSGLKELQFIESINLSGHNISNINGLNHLVNLKILNLTSNNLTEIGYSSTFKSVTSLIVRDNLFENLDGLERFENLEFLDISDNANLQSLSVLDKLEKLAILRIGYAPNLKKQIVRLKMMRTNIEVRDF